MNTGIQDAYNLVWKMAAVLRGESGEKLLETYNEERLENAKNLLQTTDRLFHLGAGDEWYLAFLRTTVVPPLAGYILGLDAVKKVVFPHISQIGISYRHSSLSQHAGDENFGVKAGDRMPYLKIEGQSIYNRLREAKFHWLLFSDEPEQNTWDTEYSKLIDTHVFPLLPQVKECFGTSKPFGVLLRPDNYIALLSVDSFHSAQDYLHQMINRYAIHAGPK